MKSMHKLAVNHIETPTSALPNCHADGAPHDKYPESIAHRTNRLLPLPTHNLAIHQHFPLIENAVVVHQTNDVNPKVKCDNAQG